MRNEKLRCQWSQQKVERSLGTLWENGLKQGDDRQNVMISIISWARHNDNCANHIRKRWVVRNDKADCAWALKWGGSMRNNVLNSSHHWEGQLLFYKTAYSRLSKWDRKKRKCNYGWQSTSAWVLLKRATVVARFYDAFRKRKPPISRRFGDIIPSIPQTFLKSSCFFLFYCDA